MGAFCSVCQGFTFRLRENFLSEFRRGQREELLTHFAVQGSPVLTRSLE